MGFHNQEMEALGDIVTALASLQDLNNTLGGLADSAERIADALEKLTAGSSENA